ncbi:FUSC family protein [Rhodococcus sp. NPDC003318]|uniref:FUSC family protein n=1 Tax=Rhodococcus sp. NPDC003318 TaxID=3364503 RepID=UPI0036C79921
MAKLVAWSWAPAAITAVAAVPAAVLTATDVQAGAAATLGVLPAAAVGIPSRRRHRVVLLVAGPLLGLSMMLGSLVSSTPVLALVTIFALAVGSVRLARVPRWARLGTLTTALVLPMVGIGLSFDGIDTTLRLTGLFTAGSAVVWLLSLLLPSTPGADRPRQPAPPAGYGYLLGAVGVVTAAIGFALDLDHVGWACAAALLVMRPDPQLQWWRTTGRFVSVVAGAALATSLVYLDPPQQVYCLVFPVVIGLAAGIHGSRFYLLPLFTTFFVILLLGYSDLAVAQSRLLERVGETALGLGAAAVIGVAGPAVFARARRDANRRAGARDVKLQVK